MKFPKEKPKVILLAHDSSIGFQANTTTFPQPPNKIANILTDITDYTAKRDEITASEAHTKQLYNEAEEIFDRISTNTKSNLRYAESIAKGNDAILSLVKWGNPAPPSALVAPGEPRALEIIGQGDGWVQIDWKEPLGGGHVASYVVQLSTDGAVNFKDVKAETETESILLNQPKGENLVYQVVAINRAGTSAPSGIVKLVL